MSNNESDEEVVITLLEFEDEQEVLMALNFFGDVPFLMGDTHEPEDIEEILNWMMEVQTQLVIAGHYLTLEGPSAFMAQQLVAMAQAVWSASLRVASMTAELKERGD